MEITLVQGEKIDEIGFGGLRIIQHPNQFSYGIDAVLVSDFACQTQGKAVLDLGTGNGIIPLIVSHKLKNAQITGVEKQKIAADRAKRTVEINRLEQRIEILHCDLLEVASFLETGTFDKVITNPPYVEKGKGLVSKEDSNWISRHETSATLKDFIAVAAQMLCDRGNFYMIHRPTRLADIIYDCRRFRLEPKTLRFISAQIDTAPNLLLIHCVKHGNPELKLLDPLYVYKADRTYSDEIQRIYERA